MVRVKFGQHELDISKNDLILDNETYIQIITKIIGSVRDSYHPSISKIDFMVQYYG